MIKEIFDVTLYCRKPESDTELVNKKYVDDAVGGEDIWDRTVVPLTCTYIRPHTSGDWLGYSSDRIIRIYANIADFTTLTVGSLTGVVQASAGVISASATLATGTSIATPTSDLHVANKKYVDDAISPENLWDRFTTYLLPHTVTDELGATATRIVKGWFSNLEITNPYSLNGTAQQNIAISASPTFAGLTLTGLTGVLKATVGVVSGSATTTDLTEGDNLYYTDARTRAAISCTATGLTYTSATGVLSLTANYVIPTTTEETNWNDAYSKRVDTWNLPLSLAANVASIAASTYTTLGAASFSATDFTVTAGAVELKAGGTGLYWDRFTTYLLPHTATDELGNTSNRLQKGWFTNLEITNAYSLNGVAQQDISTTSTPTFAQLNVDNLRLDGNILSSISGAINVSPFAGSAVVLDSHWSFDGATMTGLTNDNTTLTAYVGKNITIEGVTFDGGIATGAALIADGEGAYVSVITGSHSSIQESIKLRNPEGGNANTGVKISALYGTGTEFAKIEFQRGVGTVGIVAISTSVANALTITGGAVAFAGALSGITTLNMSSTLTNSSLNVANGIVQTDGSGVFSTSANVHTATTIGTKYIYRVDGTDVALADGGTAASLTADLGGIVYSTASSLAILVHHAAANHVLLSGAAAAPTWSTATYPVTTTANQILYSSSTNVIGEITTANSSVMITNGTGIPSFSTSLPDNLTTNTQTVGDSSTKLATTAFVAAAISSANLWDRAGTTPNFYLMPHTITDPMGATTDRIAKAWFTDLDSSLLTVDNLNLNGNTLSSTSGNINTTPVAGSAFIVDSHWSFDGATVTGITNNDTTITAYTAKAVKLTADSTSLTISETVGQHAFLISPSGVSCVLTGRHATALATGQITLYEAGSGNMLLTANYATGVIKLAVGSAVPHWQFGINTFTALTGNNTTFNAYPGNNITIENVTFDGGVVAAITQLTVDNLRLDGNTLSSTTGNINATPVAGSAFIVDSHWSFDADTITALTDNDTEIIPYGTREIILASHWAIKSGYMRGATDANSVFTAYAGKNITVEDVTFDGGVVAGITTLNMSSTLTNSSLNVAGGIAQTDVNGVFSTSKTLPNHTLATTQAATDSSTEIATTAFVHAQPAWKLISEQVISADTTALSFTNLTGNTHKIYKIVINGIAAALGTEYSTVYIMLNADNGSNYDTAYTYNGSSSGGASINGTSGQIGVLGRLGGQVEALLYAKQGAGNANYRTWTALSYERAVSTQFIWTLGGRWTNTADEITQIDVVFSNYILSGGNISLWAMY